MLKYIQGKVQNIQKLNEQEHLRCTISSIIAFSTLRLVEIHIASVVQLENNVQQLNISIWNGNNCNLTATFRHIFNPKVCPTARFQSWLTLRKKDDLDQCLCWRVKNIKVLSYEYLSKAVYQVICAAGVQKENSIPTIRKSWITKCIDLEATIQEFNKESRHKDGPNTVAVNYDMNLKDTIRERVPNFE
ncbi:MAG: hypothetical protein EZS28_016853 [Streblomastix strix]|uniref:BRCT domain-containing protein n=1 Tax=Streblomastix strix TaxID=222440 RepID=A0A5J4VY95_9EUKA|nr:MAG: hypothetical protein EZS28_016853 [Streblomastix strix]